MLTLLSKKIQVTSTSVVDPYPVDSYSRNYWLPGSISGTLIQGTTDPRIRIWKKYLQIHNTDFNVKNTSNPVLIQKIRKKQ